MGAPTPFYYEKRTMKLKTLASISAIFVISAVVALGFSWWGATSTQGRLKQPILRDLDFGTLQEIRIISAKDTVHLFNHEGSWQVREQSDFNADTHKINQLLVGFTREKIVHLVTERLEKLADLNLLTKQEAQAAQKAATGKPAMQGVGTEVVLLGQNQNILFHLVVGGDRVAKIRGRPAFGGQYIRLQKENAAFLIGKNLSPDTAPTAWLANSVHSTVYTEEGEDLRKVSASIHITLPQKGRLRLYRKSTSSPWQVEGLGLAELDHTEVNDLLNQVFGLEIESVLRKGTPQISPANRIALRIETFDGQRYLYDIENKPSKGELYAIGFSADYDESLIDTQALGKHKGDADQPSPQEKVARFKQKWEGRVFSLVKWNLERLTKTQIDLKKQKP